MLRKYNKKNCKLKLKEREMINSLFESWNSSKRTSLKKGNQKCYHPISDKFFEKGLWANVINNK